MSAYPSFHLPVSPIRINLSRPKCFCGFTSVSVYPEQASNSDSCKSVRKTNWVYECHFTPTQRGMVSPDPCEDCEDARQCVLAITKGNNSTSASIAPESTLVSRTGMRTSYAAARLLHVAEVTDQVEVWPRGKSNPVETVTKHTTGAKPTSWTTTTTTTGTGTLAEAVGEDMGRTGTFQGLAFTDSLKVCGFHMHALEWHHMQTVGMEEILETVRRTKCEVFNFSVVRWLGDKVKTNVVDDSNNGSNNNNNNNTTTTNNNTSSMGMKLKLYRNITCDCGVYASIAKGPTIPSPFRPPSKEKQFHIVCHGRALTDPNLEIVHSSLKVHSRAQLAPPMSSGNKVRKCTFKISIDIAIFWSLNTPIHSRIDNNAWLAQWFSPPNKTPAAHSHSGSVLPPPFSTFRSRLTHSSFPSSRTPLGTVVCDISSPRRTGQMVSTLQKSLTIGERITDKRSTTTQNKPSFPLMSKSTLVAGLEELDRELEESVAWHVAKVTSIMGVQEKEEEEGSSSISSVSPLVRSNSEGGEYTNYKEINMEEMYPGIAMHLCQRCNDEARDFCVVPTAIKGNQRESTPITATSTSTVTMHSHTWCTRIEDPWYTTADTRSDWFLPSPPPQSPERNTWHGTNAMGSTQRGLERVDKELERVMERHAEATLETMEVRSQLGHGLLLCRGCEFQAAGRDVLPCSHALLCIDCVRQLEFYLMPRRSSL
ncbi:MAG: hypothetical protein J3R72DRAFT_432171 [Linnemannia gamsii]|nr:MAG: hypothetical protein J3R72DRAFT_432171 [Linnemannia gamsii]